MGRWVGGQWWVGILTVTATTCLCVDLGVGSLVLTVSWSTPVILKASRTCSRRPRWVGGDPPAESGLFHHRTALQTVARISGVKLLASLLRATF